MVTYGLTGGIGMGKSLAATLLEKRGVPVVDTDVLAREIVEPGRPALAEIRRIFGDEVILESGALNRRKLGEIVFRDEAARKALEGMLHPRIRALWLEKLDRWKRLGKSKAVVVIPLLFETGAEPNFQKIICVGCSEAVQSARLRDRGWSEGEIMRRNQSQWPVPRKIDQSDYVIWNESSIAICEEQLCRII